MWYLVGLLVNNELFKVDTLVPQNKSGFALWGGDGLLYTMRGQGYRFHAYSVTGSVLDDCDLRFVLVDERLNIRRVSYNVLLSRYVNGEYDFYNLESDDIAFSATFLNWNQWWLLTHFYDIHGASLINIEEISKIEYNDNDNFYIIYFTSTQRSMLTVKSHYTNNELQALFAKFKLIEPSLNLRLKV